MANVEVLFIEGGTLVVTALGLIIGGVWTIGKLRDEIMGDVVDRYTQIVERVDEVSRDANDNVSTMQKQTNEAVFAIREKVTQVEFYVRDNYVSKETFQLVTDRILAELRTMTEKLDNRCSQMENKIMEYLHNNRPGQPGTGGSRSSDRS